MADRRLDVLIVGGGGAGLWLLDRLRRDGVSALLIEKTAIGTGQTIAAQGIIHGGLKYTLSGVLNASARAIRDMPDLWRRCLRGDGEPDLSGARIHSPRCLLWRSKSLRSRVGMLGAQKGLRSAAEKLADTDRPAVLKDCPGDVFDVAEQVVDVASVLQAFGKRNEHCIMKGDVTFDSSSKTGCSATLVSGDRSLAITADHIVLTAGAGNAALRAQLRLPQDAMQRRPLHMVMVRGNLPPLFGHCVDWDKTRATITSTTGHDGTTVWYIGGQVSEDGVHMEPDALIRHTRDELIDIIPGWRDEGFEWSTFRVDRAEAKTPGGLRPAGPQIKQDGSVITAWPTKLALVPELADNIVGKLGHLAGHDSSWLHELGDWPRPDVAPYPWEEVVAWQRLD